MKKKRPPKPPVEPPAPPVNPIVDFIKNFFSGASGNTRKMALLIVLSGIIVEYPKCIAWLGHDTGAQVYEYAKQFRNLGGAALLIFLKSFNATGGTVDAGVQIKKVLK